MSTANVVAHSVACSLPASHGRRISDATLEAIRSISLVDVAGAVVSLRRAGQRFIALCPFHNEKHPSFNIDPQKNLWFCHGCSAGGDVIGFVERIEGCDFRAAVNWLAARAGISVTDGVIDRSELAAQAERRRNREALRREQIKTAIELDLLRSIRRTSSLDKMPADIFTRLRRADVRYVLLCFLREDDAIEFLRSSPVAQLERINQALDDGYVIGDRTLWEVPLQ